MVYGLYPLLKVTIVGVLEWSWYERSF